MALSSKKTGNAKPSSKFSAPKAKEPEVRQGLKKEDLQAIRSAFEEDQGHDLRLTDDAISAIVNKLGGIGSDEWESMPDDEKMKLFVKAEDAVKGIQVSDPSINAIVAKMDDLFLKELDECVDATMKAKTTAVDIYAQFRRTMSKTMLDETPFPDFDEKDVVGTNFRPDIYEKKTPTGKVRVVWSNDLVQAMPKGKQYQLDIDEGNKAIKDITSVPRFKEKSKKELKAIVSTATAQRNALRSMVKRALAIHHQFQAVEAMPLVSIEWIRGFDKARCAAIPKEYGKGTEEGSFLVTLSPKPLWICPIVDGKVQGSEGNDFSITQLLAFDVPKAIKLGGTVSDLKESAKAEPSTPETATFTPEVMDTNVVTTWAMLSQKDNIAALRKRLVAPDNEDTREAYCALALIMYKSIYEPNRKWYEARLEADTEGGDTEAARESA